MLIRMTPKILKIHKKILNLLLGECSIFHMWEKFCISYADIWTYDKS